MTRREFNEAEKTKRQLHRQLCAAYEPFDLPDGLRAHMNAMRARPAFRRAAARG